MAMMTMSIIASVSCFSVFSLCSGHLVPRPLWNNAGGKEEKEKYPEKIPKGQREDKIAKERPSS